MERLGIAMFIVISIYFFVLIIDPYKKQSVPMVIPFLALALMAIHLVFETRTWQLYPLYFLTVLACIVSLIAVIEAKTAHTGSRTILFNGRNKMIFLTAVVLIGSGMAVWAFPFNEMPMPSGRYEIGTATYDFKETGIKEIYGDASGTDRRIKVQVWYPASRTEGLERTPWLADGRVVARVLASEMKAPIFILDHTKDVLSHAFEGAQMSTAVETFPVIILSHGWSGFRNLHSDLAEMLASNGYIVLGIDHTFGSQVTVFKDGTIETLDHGALPDRESTYSFLDYAKVLESTFADDVTYVLNQLYGFNDGLFGSLFKERLNLDKVGLLGHSTGGGADVIVAISDARIKAILGMDAWVEPIQDGLIMKGLKIPALFLRSEEWETGYNNANLTKLIDNSRTGTVLYQIDGTTHIDFTMAYMYSRLTRYIGYTGEVDRKTMDKIHNRIVIDFFDKALKDVGHSSLGQASDIWPIVKLIQLK